MANPFDQFDSKQSSKNEFDKFDAANKSMPQMIDTELAVQQALEQLASEQSGFDAALISAGKGFADILRGIGLMDEADETEKRAYEALKKARPITSTVGEIAGQALPFAAAGAPLVAGIAGTGGRIAASAGLGALEGGVIARGQGEDVAKGALTGAAFGAGGQAVGEAIDVGRRLIGGNSAGNEAVEYASSRGLPIMTTDVIQPSSGVGKMARNVGEQIPVAGTSGARATQQQARVSELDSLRELYPEVTDDVIYQSLIRSQNKFKEVTGKRYDDIASKMSGAPIQINKTISTIDNELANLTKGGTIQDRETVSKLQQLKDDLLSGDQSFQGLRDNRTFVREQLKSDRPSTQADRVIDRVYNSMTDDMQEAVTKNIGADEARRLKQVDQLFAIEKQTQKKTKLKNILSSGDIKPELATKMIFSSSPSEVRAIYSSLDKQGRANARAAIVNKITDTAGDSPEKFLSAMKRYDSQFGVFFKGAERKQLNGLKSYLQATQQAAKSGVDTLNGRQLIPYAMLGGVVSDVTTTGGAASLGFATIGGLARAYESKPVRIALMRLASAPKGSEAYNKAVSAVNSAFIAAKEQDDGDNGDR